MIRGLVLSKYGTRAASTRQRFVQIEPYLRRRGIAIEIEPLLDNDYLDQLFTGRKRDLGAVVRAYARRLSILRNAGDYDFLWVHCELFPYLPSFAERQISRMKTPVIFDFDDAIFHQYDQHSSRLVRVLLGEKLAPLLQRANVSFCGNAYLEAYAKRFGRPTEVVPTTVDINAYVPRAAGISAPSVPVVGWIGSPATWPYCREVASVLAPFVQAGRIKVLVVGANHAADSRLPFEFREWSEARELADIQAMDIGIMPVPDLPWARGKCGYKLIQYMACKLPVIASPVGVNASIVKHGANGFLAATPDDWRDSVETLITNHELRRSMGAYGRVTVGERFSVQVHGPRIGELISGLVAQ